MKRKAIQSLIDWKQSTGRKPSLFQGARQVGKTWLLKEFGRQYFDNVAYINLDKNEAAQHIFDHDYSIERIVMSLQLHCGQNIVPEKTLIILDEIQEAPRAVTCLKYFQEDAPQYYVASAGSYLRVASLQGTGFPVGKVDTINLHPMSYLEFLEALGKERFAELLEKRDWTTASVFRETFIEYLKYYYIVGGMPEAVASFAADRDFRKVRMIQKGLLRDFERDFGKHTPSDIVSDIRLIWNSVPSQLAKENKKFILSKLEKHARMDDLAPAIQWLCNAGLLYRVPRISKPAMPLSAYTEENIFKLFSLDVGLLSAQSDLDPRSILEGNRVLTEFKGALTEQYVHQQLLAETDISPFYWANGSNEIDYLFQHGMGIVPLEVKAETNLKSRSLMSFCRKFKIPFAIRISMIDHRTDLTDTLPNRRNDDAGDFKFMLDNLPLYAISQIETICAQNG